MSPTSSLLLAICVFASLVSTTFTAWAWPRGRRIRWVARPALICMCALSALCVVGVLLNRVLFIYPTWGELLGKEPPAAVETAPAPTEPGQSRMDQFSPPVGKANLSLPVFVYLPPGYDQSENIRYPVITAYSGFPGTPNTWISGTQVQKLLDDEIAARRMAPTVMVFPAHHPDPTWDSECVNAVNGPQFDTYLTEDVPAAIKQRYRVREDRTAWGIIGFSTGGYCAVNLVMRHPDRFAAAASLAGHLMPYAGGQGGNQDLYRGNEEARRANWPLWQLRNRSAPDVDIYLGTARDDPKPMAQLQEFAALAQQPMRVTTEIIPTGGHTLTAWLVLIPGALDWMSGRLATPLTLPS